MWLSLAATLLVTICATLWEFSESHNSELDLIFQQRSQQDWENVWHQERYSWCRDKIEKHLVWACEKDIYRLKRIEPEVGNVGEGVFQDKRAAFSIFNSKRRYSKRAGQITKECCSSRGCTWEEYAEYCSHNNRRLPGR